MKILGVEQMEVEQAGNHATTDIKKAPGKRIRTPRGNKKQSETPRLTIVDQGKILIDPIELTRRKISACLKVNSFDPTQEDRFHHELSKKLGELPTTDEGNSIRFWARYGHRIRWVAEQKYFIIYSEEEGRWTRAERGEVMAWAKRTANSTMNEAKLLPLPTDEYGNLLMYPQINPLDKPTPEQLEIVKQFEEREEKVDTLVKWSKQSQSRRGLEAMVELLKDEPGISILQSDLDSERTDYLFNCLNGTLDLKTFELKPHDPSHLITKLAPVTYNPSAGRAEHEKFIHKVSGGNIETARFLQDLAGCGLVGKQLDDILVINYGPGGNGKGIFAETQKGWMGDYAGTANSDLFLAKDSDGISNDRACLTGVRFLTASETDEGRKLNEALVKTMTGGDTQKVRFLHREFFDMRPQFTPLLFTNHKPIIGGTDKGIWRRVKLVPWMHDFENDPEVETRHIVMERLQAEYSGMLNWALEGLKNRMKTAQIQVPSDIKQETDAYRKDSDTLGEFIEDFCIVTEYEAEVPKGDLYAKYREFAVNAGQNNVTTEKGFAMKLRERTDIRYLRNGRKSGAVRYWAGIRLRTEYDPVTPTEETQASDGPPTSTSEPSEEFSKQYERACELLFELEQAGASIEYLPDGKRTLHASNSTPEQKAGWRERIVILDAALRDVHADIHPSNGHSSADSQPAPEDPFTEAFKPKQQAAPAVCIICQKPKNVRRADGVFTCGTDHE
jgi:phage/plasmid primase, P4 family, C-terminal domain